MQFVKGSVHSVNGVPAVWTGKTFVPLVSEEQVAKLQADAKAKAAKPKATKAPTANTFFEQVIVRRAVNRQPLETKLIALGIDKLLDEQGIELENGNKMLSAFAQVHAGWDMWKHVRNVELWGKAKAAVAEATTPQHLVTLLMALVR
jgi:hypothetical protein